MPIEVKIDAEHRVISETWRGPIIAEDVRRLWTGYLADEHVMAIRRTVADLRDAQILFKSGELLELVSDIAKPGLGTRTWRTAIVVNDPSQYGISRQYHIFASSYSSDAIFYDLESANIWLKSGKNPA